jgi:hypothetical protein
MLPFATGAFVTSYKLFTGNMPAWLAWSSLIPGFMLLGGCVYGWWFLTRPRIVFEGATVRLNVGKGHPVAVPVELVEAFLIGKGPAYLNGRDDYKTETATFIVKIAERAEEYAKLPTQVRIAAWCGGYVTFRGTYTEPLSVDLVNRLNQRLHDVQHATAERIASC